MTETLLLGAGGFLAQEIIKRYPGIIALCKKDCDITNRKQVLEVIKEYKPAIIINCAAITDLRFCEQNSLQAWQVNVIGVRNIAEAARKSQAFVVHFSSDYALNPVNEYGWTKLASEHLVPGLVLRANFYNRSHWLFNLLSQGRTVNLVENNQFNPITTNTLLWYMSELIKIRHSGIVNIGVRDRLSYYEFGLLVQKTFKLNSKLINPIPITSLQLGYEYPKDTYLNLNTIKRLGFKILSAQQDMELLRNETG